MARLDVNYLEVCQELDKLVDLQSHLEPLPLHYRKLIAEIILLRAFALLEDAFCSMACKIACGVPYCDGTHAFLLVRARSARDAIDKMRRHGRTKPHFSLSWTRASEIKENLKYIVRASEHFMMTIDAHGMFIDEIRRIRNRVAHNNQKSRRDYQRVVLRYYGAYLNSVNPGTLLLTARHKPTLLEAYLKMSRILVKQLVRAYET